MTTKRLARDKMFAAFRAAGMTDEATNAIEDYIDAVINELQDALWSEIQDAVSQERGR